METTPPNNDYELGLAIPDMLEKLEKQAKIVPIPPEHPFADPDNDGAQCQCVEGQSSVHKTATLLATIPGYDVGIPCCENSECQRSAIVRAAKTALKLPVNYQN